MTRRRHPRRVAAVLAAIQLVVSPPATSQEDEAAHAEARQHFDAGVELMRIDDWDGALAEFARSLELYPTRSALFNLGMCRKALHEYRTAIAVFDEWQARYGVTAPLDEVEAVAAAMRELRRYLGTVSLTVQPAGTELLVDHQLVGVAPLPAALPLEVGRHTVEARREGYETQTAEVVVASGEEQAVVLLLEPVPPAVAPPPAGEPPLESSSGVEPTWFWVAAGSALALGIGSAITGVMVGQSTDDFYAALSPCQGGDVLACAAGLNAADDHDAYQEATWVMLPTAIAAAVASAVLAFYTDWAAVGSEAPSSVGVMAGPTASADGIFDGLGFGVAVTF
ncbi:MAG: PEGA domain-containing protein [Deltaproteobacteria bacterium]|nr:PEGA domain-containing protein [Deltaproteobacteria bacterium]